MIGQYERVDIDRLYTSGWTTTKHTKRQVDALEISIQTLGQLQPFVVREGGSGTLQIIDGEARWRLLKKLGAVQVDVLNLGAVDDCKALEIHLALNLDHGKPAAEPLADALEAVVQSRADPKGQAFKEVRLLELLPLRSSGIDKTVEKLRKRAAPKPPHNPNAPHGWVRFRFDVDPGAALVCDQALTRVEKSTGCKRGVAFERIMADALAGPNPGRQP